MSETREIIVAVDGSKASDAAVKWAANTATKRGEPLKLVSSYSVPQFLYAEGMVPPQELYDDLETEVLEKIEQARQICKDFNPELVVSHHVQDGNPIDMLLDMAKNARMLVMGSRGLGGLSGMVMGSVSAAVVSHATCPVVVVREDSTVFEETKYGPVVVGVDGSEISQKAIELAFVEAQARGAVLRAVHTWIDVHVQTSLAGLNAAEKEWAQVEKEQHELFRKNIAPFVEWFPDVEIEPIVTRDRPVRALADAAIDAQLLVVGSHGRGGFRGMLLGSTSRALLQSAPCPLMVVRPETEI